MPDYELAPGGNVTGMVQSLLNPASYLSPHPHPQLERRWVLLNQLPCTLADNKAIWLTNRKYAGNGGILLPNYIMRAMMSGTLSFLREKRRHSIFCRRSFGIFRTMLFNRMYARDVLGVAEPARSPFESTETLINSLGNGCMFRNFPPSSVLMVELVSAMRFCGFLPSPLRPEVILSTNTYSNFGATVFAFSMAKALQRMKVEFDDADDSCGENSFTGVVKIINYFCGRGRQKELCRLLKQNSVLRKLIVKNLSILKYLCKARRRCILKLLVKMEREALVNVAPVLLVFTESKAVRGCKERVVALIKGLIGNC